MGKPDTLSRRADHGNRSDGNSSLMLLTPGFFAIRALAGLEAIREERDLLKDIHRSTRDEEHEEAIAKVVEELKSTHSCTVRLAERTLVGNGMGVPRGAKVLTRTLTLRGQGVQ
jgi:hypothetical protein